MKLALLLLLWSSAALAMGPNPQVERFFTDARREDRTARIASKWKTEAEITAAFSEFRALLGDSNLAPCRLQLTDCRSGNIRQWVGWDYWLSLNVEAAELWNALVESQSGDVEKARIAYFGAKLDPALRARLWEYHGRVRDFVSTTSIQWIDAIDDLLRLRDIGDHLPVHPLFSQVLIELGSVFVRYHSPGGWGFEDAYPRDFGDAVEEVTDPSPVMPPSTRAFLMREQAGMAESFEIVEPSSSPYARPARALVNTLLILKLIPFANDHASQSGLWPEAVVRWHFISSMQTVQSNRRHRGQSSWHSFMLTLGLAGDAEGFASEMQSRLPEPLRETKLDLIPVFRALAERYGITPWERTL